MNNTITLEVYGLLRNGWLGISFHNYSVITSNSALMLIIQAPDYAWMVSSHNTTQTLPLEFLVEKSTNLIIDDMFHFTIEVPNSVDLFATKFVAFAQGDRVNGNMSITGHKMAAWKPTTFSRPDLELFGWCDPRGLGHTGRILTETIWSTLFGIALHVVIIYLILRYRNVQPLKSRGLGPLITSFALLVNLMVTWVETWAFSWEEQYSFACFTGIFMQYPCVLISVIVPFSQLFRYVALNDVNFHKKKVVEEYSTSETASVLPLRVRILMKLTQPVVGIFTIVSVLIIYYISCVVIISMMGWGCKSQPNTIIRYILLGLIFIATALAIIAVLIDAWNSRNALLTCRLKYFYIETDHFFYRSELAMAPFGFLVSFLWVLAPTAQMIRITFCELIFWSVLWVSGGWALIITIYQQSIKKCCKKKTRQSKSILDDYIANPELFESFLEFCCQEYSLENIYMYKAVQDYKKTKSIDQRMLIAQKIKMDFIAINAPFEVNFSGGTKINVLQQIDNGNLGDHLFDECERDLGLNLADTISRYMFSDFYVAYREKMRILNDQSLRSLRVTHQ